MTSSLKDKIAEARDIRSALEVVSAEPELSGALKISGGGVKGAVAFARGKLVGAFVDKSGETGQSALEKLLELTGATIKYAKFDENQIVQAERIEVDIKQLLQGGLVNAGAPPILNKMSEVVAASASPSAEKAHVEAPAEADSSETVEIKADPALVDFLRNKSATPPSMRPQEHKRGQGNGAKAEPETAATPEPKAESAKEPKAEAVSEPAEPQAASETTLDETGSETVQVEALGQPEKPAAESSTAEPPKTETAAEAPSVTEAEHPVKADLPDGTVRLLDEVFDPDLTPAVTFPTLRPDERLTEDFDPNRFNADGTPREHGLTPEQIADLEKSKEISAPPEDFVNNDGLLDMTAASLTDEQRRLMGQLGQSMSDPEAFHEADPQLAAVNEEQGLSDHQLELLSTAPLDEKPFDVAEKHIENDLPSLNAEQQEALDLARKEHRDIETFEQLDDFLQEKGLQLTSDQLWQLGEVMFARSRDEMLEEFSKIDHRLKLPDKEDFREFVEHEGYKAPEVADLDAIPTPSTIDADYAPLIAMQEGLPQPKKAGAEGIIGRMRDAIAGRLGVYEGPRKREAEFPIGKVIGALTLLGLCLGIFTIPAAIREAASGKSSEQLAQEQMRILIEEDISSESPSTARDEARSSYGGQGSVSGGGGGGGGGGGEGGASETLSFARSLAAKGNVEAAIGYYEQAISANPAAIGARIELIQAYLTTKKHQKARALCLSTLKCKLTDSEIALVWSLLRQCLSN